MNGKEFKDFITKNAQRNIKNILLPEGESLRVLKAAITCRNQGFCNPILIGNKKNIHQLAKQHSLGSISNLEIIDPSSCPSSYIQFLYDYCKKYYPSYEAAKEGIIDPLVLGSVMLKLNKVDGVVAGARYTTSDFLRYVFRIVGIKPGFEKAFSAMFVLLENQVEVYIDCAVNINPSPKELANMAVTIANVANKFNLQPKIALISFQTLSTYKKTLSKYPDYTKNLDQSVAKALKATLIAKELNPNLKIDGPLQYDAACCPIVAQEKNANAIINGDANIFIFPDITSANAVYKAVQKKTNSQSVGPIVLGLNKPMNDLSRGSSVEDIVFTIIATAAQSNFS